MGINPEGAKQGGKNRVSPSQETVAQCAYWRGRGSDCWLAWLGEWNLLAHTKRSRDAWISLAQCRKRNPKKEECWCGYIVYDPLTPIPWPCPMKGTRRYSLHQGIEKYIGEGSATTSLCHHKHCHGYFIDSRGAVRAAGIKQTHPAARGQWWHNHEERWGHLRRSHGDHNHSQDQSGDQSGLHIRYVWQKLIDYEPPGSKQMPSPLCSTYCPWWKQPKSSLGLIKSSNNLVAIPILKLELECYRSGKFLP